jgi:hypothetical protein
LTNHKDHLQKAAFHPEDEESPSSDPVDLPQEETLPVYVPQEAPQADPPAPEAAKPPVPPPYIVVAERHEVQTSVGPTTVIFRPGQHLSSPHLIELARINNIATKEL